MNTLWRNIALIFCLSLIACASHHNSEFDLNKEDYADSSNGNRKPPIYITGSKSIDSADVTKCFLQIWKAEADNYPKEVRIFARVLDSTGNFITHLAPPYTKGDDYMKYWSQMTETLNRDTAKIKDFKVREYGEQDSIPYAISLVLDHGGSMGGTIEALQEGAGIFISLKRSYDKVAVIKFGNKSIVDVPLTSNTQALLSSFQEKGLDKKYGFYTAMYDAAKEGILQLKDTPPDQPRILVLFTDGEDNFSKTTDVEVYQLAKKHSVRIFPVGFGYTNDDVLQSLAQFTGGKSYRAYSKKELVSVFRDIYMGLRSFYKISYTPVAPIDSLLDGLHILKVNVNLKGGNDSALTAFYEYDKGPFNRLSMLDQIFGSFKAILFDFNKATLRPESMPAIENIAQAMQRYIRIKLEVDGHTDNVGTEDFNQKLSEARAEAVVQSLIKYGVEASRLRSRGFGFTMPKELNDTEEHRQINRRTEFKIIAK